METIIVIGILYIAYRWYKVHQKNKKGFYGSLIYGNWATLRFDLANRFSSNKYTPNSLTLIDDCMRLLTSYQMENELAHAVQSTNTPNAIEIITYVNVSVSVEKLVNEGVGMIPCEDGLHPYGKSLLTIHGYCLDKANTLGFISKEECEYEKDKMIEKAKKVSRLYGTT